MKDSIDGVRGWLEGKVNCVKGMREVQYRGRSARGGGWYGEFALVTMLVGKGRNVLWVAGVRFGWGGSRFSGVGGVLGSVRAPGCFVCLGRRSFICVACWQLSSLLSCFFVKYHWIPPPILVFLPQASECRTDTTQLPSFRKLRSRHFPVDRRLPPTLTRGCFELCTKLLLAKALSVSRAVYICGTRIASRQRRCPTVTPPPKKTNPTPRIATRVQERGESKRGPCRNKPGTKRGA